MENIRINPTKILVIDKKETVEKTAGGIFIPDKVVKRDNMQGVVSIAGAGTADVNMIYQPGDTVVYHPQAGRVFTYEDVEYRLIDISDVLLGGR